MKRVLDIEVWMLLMVAMLLTACSDHSGESSDEKDDCFLNIYVYAPEHPMLTRADVGTIASRTAKEHEVKTLQIWVFKHRDGGLVGYLEAKPTFLNETPGQEKFQIKVLDKVFADHPENVDVYVVANAGSCGLVFGKNALTLDKNTERTKLEKAMIGEGSFGVNPLVSAVPKDAENNLLGLPMSGVLKNQSIYGSYPTLRVGTQDAMATLQLIRAVSKLRFVICRKTEKENAKKKLVSIDKIQLDGSVIPDSSYLMPVEKPSYTSVGYVSTPIDYGSIAIEDIPAISNPMIYIYESQTAQEYEDLINGGIDKTIKVNDVETPAPDLKEFGLTYFRESDKKLTGTITYTVQEREKVGEGWTAWETKEKTATFSMVDKGDFLRNHSWIVYVFYMDATIYVLTVTNIGMKVWASGNFEEREVYNW